MSEDASEGAGPYSGQLTQATSGSFSNLQVGTSFKSNVHCNHGECTDCTAAAACAVLQPAKQHLP